MSERLRRDGQRVVKHLRHDCRISATQLAELSHHLQRHQVATPLCSADGSRQLSYCWAEGESARHRFADVVEEPGTGWPDAPLLLRLLSPLVALHHAPVTMTLPPLDPWLRVRPRLVPPIDEDFAHLFSALEKRWQAMPAPPARLLHGDFHIGQLLLSGDHGVPLLLDLEDACLGPREFDLGNFAVHLVSAARVLEPQRLDPLLARLSGVYQRLGGAAPDLEWLRLCADAALLRRTLKLIHGGAEKPRCDSLQRWLSARVLGTGQRPPQ